MTSSIFSHHLFDEGIRFVIAQVSRHFALYLLNAIQRFPNFLKQLRAAQSLEFVEFRRRDDNHQWLSTALHDYRFALIRHRSDQISPSILCIGSAHSLHSYTLPPGSFIDIFMSMIIANCMSRLWGPSAVRFSLQSRHVTPGSAMERTKTQ
jgi:hypothetical protein